MLTKMIQGAFSRGAVQAAIGSTVVGRGTTWGAAIGSDALRYASSGLSGLAGMGPTALYSTLGATAGGAWGMVSDDTSVLGGALAGAAIGAGGYGLTRLAAGGLTKALNPIKSTLKGGAKAAAAPTAGAAVAGPGFEMSASRSMQQKQTLLNYLQGEAAAAQQMTSPRYAVPKRRGWFSRNR